MVTLELLERRTDVVDKLQEFEAAIDPIVSVLALPEVTKHFEESGKYDSLYCKVQKMPFTCDWYL